MHAALYQSPCPPLSLSSQASARRAVPHVLPHGRPTLTEIAEAVLAEELEIDPPEWGSIRQCSRLSHQTHRGPPILAQFAAWAWTPAKSTAMRARDPAMTSASRLEREVVAAARGTTSGTRTAPIVSAAIPKRRSEYVA